ncbi:uncharacterized protein LOC144136441 isoform X2 [Amblyomma americanum]
MKQWLAAGDSGSLGIFLLLHVMSAVATKRDKRKKSKPRLSFGSSSGACTNLPSNMQANLTDLFALLKRQQQAHVDEPHYDANGNTTGWSAHKNARKDDLLMYPESGLGTYSARSSPDSTQLSDGKEFQEVGEDDSSSICVDDVPVDDESEYQVLTDADVADIVRQLRDFLQENGPSQEDDLLKVLSAQQARQVLSEYSTLANFVDRHPGFRQLHEELHSFLYYQDPEDDDDDDCDYYSTPTVAPGGAHNGLPSLAGSKKVGSGEEPEQPTAADDGGPRGARASSCSSTSYESAVEDEVEEKGKKVVSLKDGSSQTPSRPRCLSRALQAVQLTRDTEAQTEGWDPAQFAELELMLKKRNNEISELQERLASLQEDHAREMQQLHLKIEELQNRPLVAPSSPSQPLQNEADQEVNNHHVVDEEEGEDEVESPRGAVATIREAGDLGNGEVGQCQLPQAQPSPLLLRRKSPPVRAEPEDVKLRVLSIEPRPRPVGPPADHKGKRTGGLYIALDRSQVPEFYDLHWHMERSAAPCSDVESMYSSRGGSPTKSKTEQQIMKIVQMVKKQQPNYTELEIRRHVDYVRHSQGGFSRMTFNHIVALVLGHMKTTAAATMHNMH